MEINLPEDDEGTKSEELRALIEQRLLPNSIAKLSGSSRGFPSQKNFHFYNNFEEFKHTVEDIDLNSKNLLQKIGASEGLFWETVPFPDGKNVEIEDDEAFDWLEKVNDELCERFDVSLDEFTSFRKSEGASSELDNGTVNGKEKLSGVEEVKVAAKVKPKLPFHIHTLPRPQDEYKIIVNNSNQPFEHVWLHRSEDGTRFMHPLEKLSVLDFIDQSDDSTEPVKPPPLELTPFKFVEDVKDLKQLATKLRSVDEFAVDLEHNQYRSFQGLTCLMQISTRTEDFVIDTLKLKVQIGPHLRDVFKDPTKRKVFHGADRDIIWLQRDFGIYVCNMFDTGQASRVLKMERYSLEHLLQHFCGVTANKEYQNADWRIRPLPHVMTKYAREDTHYLLYIYDVMRRRLLMSPAESEDSDPPLVQVYKRSYDICIKLYEKELLSDSSYLHIHGLHDAGFNAQQLAVVSGLYKWRDAVGRAEDESTGYILPNKTLIEIAKQMPLTTNNLRRMLKTKHAFIERSLDSVVGIIRHSIKKAAEFEKAVVYLKEKRLGTETKENNESGVLPPNACKLSKTSDNLTDSTKAEYRNIGSSKVKVGTNIQSGATVSVQKKPNRALGSLLGNSAKRKSDPNKMVQSKTKLEQIPSSSSLPSGTFLVRDKKLQPELKKSPKIAETSRQRVAVLNSSIIEVEDDSDTEKSRKNNSKSTSDDELEKYIADFAAELDADDEDDDFF